MVTKKKIIEISNIIAKGIKPYKIILFGSYAYGTPNKDSDIDICVIKKNINQKLKKRVK